MSTATTGAPRPRSGGLDPEVRARLDAERDFLLRSLDDLEAEHAEGELDAETYARLHADYTARAAELLRRIDDPAELEPRDAARPAADEPGGGGRRRRTLVTGALVVFAVGAALALGSALGDRSPTGTATGNDQVAEGATAPGSPAPALAAAVAADPNDVAARLAYGRALLASDPSAALEQYRAAADRDPASAEAHAYAGWLLVRTTDPDAPAAALDAARRDALAHLAVARAADPAHPDAQVFTGLVYLNDVGDAEAALPYLQQYLALAPDGPLVEEVRSAVTRALAAVRDRAEALADVVAADPDDVEARLELARALIAVEPTAALDQYAEVARRAPARPEPAAFRGWIAALAAQQTTDPAVREELTASALERLAEAHRLEPDYAPAWVFEGVVRLDLADDVPGARDAFARALELAPDGPLASQAREGQARVAALSAGG